MQYQDLEIEAEDTEHSAAERSAAATRSTWVSVGVGFVGMPIGLATKL